MHERTQKNETRPLTPDPRPLTPDPRSLIPDPRSLIPDPCLSVPGPDHAIIQKRTAAIQKSPYLAAQRKQLRAAFGRGAGVVQRAENKTGIPDEVKARMETAFDSDFSAVRVHPSSSAAPAVGALAYTQGTDIHFAPGQFSPDTSAGQRLLGHELAHVQQQSQGRVQPTTEINGLPVNDSPALEEEAERLGSKAIK